MSKTTEPTIEQISRQQFSQLANPVKHYLIDDIGMDELNAGLMAANIVEAQSNTVLALIANQVAKARINELEQWKRYWKDGKDTRNTDTYVADRIATLNGVKNK